MKRFTFRAILAAPHVDREVFCEAVAEPYGEAVGVPWLGHAMEIEVVSVSDHNGKEISQEITDDEYSYLKSIASERQRYL